jgi:hypothetical protein
LLRVGYWWFRNVFRKVRCSSRTVRRTHAHGSPGGRGQSAWGFAVLLSPLLLEFRFRFGIVWGLFLRLVGPLTTRPWQTHVGILSCEFGTWTEFSLWRRIYISSHSLPPLWSPNRSFRTSAHSLSPSTNRVKGRNPAARSLKKQN